MQETYTRSVIPHDVGKMKDTPRCRQIARNLRTCYGLVLLVRDDRNLCSVRLVGVRGLVRRPQSRLTTGGGASLALRLVVEDEVLQMKVGLGQDVSDVTLCQDDLLDHGLQHVHSLARRTAHEGDALHSRPEMNEQVEFTNR